MQGGRREWAGLWLLLAWLSACAGETPASPVSDAGVVSCDDQVICAPLGLSCLGGICEAPQGCAAASDCPVGSSCRPDGLCEPMTSLGGSGRTCNDRYDCDPGEACLREKCAAWALGTSCANDADCGRGRVCSASAGCVEGCRRRLDCADELACDEVSLRCEPCGAAVACESGERCVEGRCKAGCASTGCPDGSRCEAATGLCVQARCGDGFVTGTEACDDGNLVAGDGCGPTCDIETAAGCARPGRRVLDWGASPAPAIEAAGSAWAIRSATSSAGPPDGAARKFLSSNGGRTYGADRNDAVRIPLDLSDYQGCHLTVSFPVWYELEPGRDGANLQVADTSVATPAWEPVGAFPGSMGYDRAALSTSGCASCFLRGQPVWSNVNSVSAQRTVSASLPALAATKTAALRFTLHSDALSNYRGLWVGNITLEAR